MDSRSLSTGSGHLVILAVELACAGYDGAYIAKSLDDMKGYLDVSFILQTTEYLYKGGRCGGMAHYGANLLNLHPEVFPRDNYLTWVLGIIYTLDTNTGVCPSLHVGYSLGIASTWLREKTVPRWVRTGIAIWCGVICISVAFVKQHSVADILAAIPMCLFAEWFVFFRKNQ